VKKKERNRDVVDIKRRRGCTIHPDEWVGDGSWMVEFLLVLTSRRKVAINCGDTTQKKGNSELVCAEGSPAIAQKRRRGVPADCGTGLITTKKFSK